MIQCQACISYFIFVKQIQLKANNFSETNNIGSYGCPCISQTKQALIFKLYMSSTSSSSYLAHNPPESMKYEAPKMLSCTLTTENFPEFLSVAAKCLPFISPRNQTVKPQFVC